MTASAEPARPEAPASDPRSYWLWAMCLLGVDYFSSLAYQPSITFEVAGLLGPLATGVVVFVTLFGALPVYAHVAGRSPHGQGSIALMEQLVHGWRGKLLILLLLGFAATDFVMTKTLSLADAAVHLIHNPAMSWQPVRDFLVEHTQDALGSVFGVRVADWFDEQLTVTLFVGVVGFVFWAVIRKGFTRKAVVLAVALVGLYLLLNAVVIGSGLAYLLRHAEHLTAWWEHVAQAPHLGNGRDTWALLLACVLFFPKLALGLSGFEMSLVVMPQVRGAPGDDPQKPRSRVRNTRKLLVLAAAIMSVYLLASVLVTTLLIPPEAFAGKGGATNRALAYLAHGGALATGAGETLNPVFGVGFGSLYDLSTVLILTFAGTSLMTALGNLLPRFLLRFGMEFRWVHKWGVLFGVFALVNLAVTVAFRASVSAQRGAYALGVLMLLSHAAVVTVLDRWKKPRFWLWRVPWWSGLVALFFLASAGAVLVTEPAGLVIAGGFIAVILISSVISRTLRSDELRTEGFAFHDEISKFLWDSLKILEFPILVPHRPGQRERDAKEECIRREHQLDPNIEIVFLEIHVEDASEFYQQLLIEVFQEKARYVIKVSRCVSVAQAIAAVALELSRVGRPPAIHFGWSELSLMGAAWSYLAFGEGNVPWKVRELILREEALPERQPRVIIG